MSADAFRGQKRVLEPLELELHVVVSQATQVPGLEIEGVVNQ